MKIKEIIAHLEQLAPLSYQESYDNAGLLVGNIDEEIKDILVSLDCTEAVIEEAIANGCNLVIAHHPIVFKGLKKITGKNYIERTIIKAIKHDIAIYAIHTNLDNVVGGVNFKIAEKLGLKNVNILAPKVEIGTKLVGSGAIGELPDAMNEVEFLFMLKDKMDVEMIRHTALLDKKIKRVAVCGGAGGFLLSHAIAQEADIFITADYKYHEFFDAENKIIIADIGHYESEQFTKDLLKAYICKKIITFAVRLSEVRTNPVNYF